MSNALAAIPQPTEDFFAAQARYRKQSLFLRALAVVAATALGVPLSVALTPIVVALLVVAIDAVNVVTAHIGMPLPDIGAIIGHWFDGVGVEIDQVVTFWDLLGVFFRHGIPLVLPGVVAMALVYVAFARSGAAALESAIETSLVGRPTRADDLEETQLSNISQEMAIAAHLPAPRVQIVDTPEVNAAILGSHPDNARLLVTRGLLDALSRDETQAVVGHLLGSIGNGDTLIVRAWLRFATALVLVGGLVSGGMYDDLPRTERPFQRTLRYLFGRVCGTERDNLLAQIQVSLENVSSGNNDDGLWTKTWAVLRLPLLICFGAFSMNRMIFMSFLIQPLTARLWRARRLLADAMAVQLTRQVTPLANALTHMTGWEAASSIDFLCISWSRAVPGAPPAALGTLNLNKVVFGQTSTLPPFDQRHDQLVRLGAEIAQSTDSTGSIARSMFGPRIGWPLAITFGILFSLCAVAALGCAFALVGIALAIYGLFLGPVVMLLHFALRWVA